MGLWHQSLRCNTVRNALPRPRVSGSNDWSATLLVAHFSCSSFFEFHFWTCRFAQKTKFFSEFVLLPVRRLRSGREPRRYAKFASTVRLVARVVMQERLHVNRALIVVRWRMCSDLYILPQKPAKVPSGSDESKPPTLDNFPAPRATRKRKRWTGTEDGASPLFQ